MHEGILRLSVFILLILVFGILKLYCPRKADNRPQKQRRMINLGLMLVNTISVRLLLPLATFEVANYVADNGIGLFNIVSLPFMLNLVMTIIVFDLLIYVQHALFHRIKPLWNIHRIHHTDTVIDVTTGIRFHPFEILLSMLLKLLAVLLLGPLAIAIIIYEIALSAASLFTHSNLCLPAIVDYFLRYLFVTPDMHRIHHSVEQNETDSNYGNIFSFWDRLFRTYKTKPAEGYDNMIIGLNEFNQYAELDLLTLLELPVYNRVKHE